VTMLHRFYSLVLMPALAIVLVIAAIRLLRLAPDTVPVVIAWPHLFTALGLSFWRILIAYVCSLAIAIPLAVMATHGKWSGRILLPFFDVLESVPILAFFPVVILFFVKYDFFDGAAIFVIFMDMMWNILFTVVGGLRSIPQDIRLAAQVFGMRGMSYFRKVLLPAITPHIITGSIIAWGQGWNIIIVAEVLHTYLPQGAPSQDLFGIGSVLVHASANGQTGLFMASVAVLVIGIGLLNILVWQRLLHYAERFKFE